MKIKLFPILAFIILISSAILARAQYIQTVKALGIDSVYCFAPYLDINSKIFYWTERETLSDKTIKDVLYSAVIRNSSSFIVEGNKSKVEMIGLPPYTSIGAASTSTDGKVMIFAACRVEGYDTTWSINYAELKGKLWEDVKVLYSSKTWVSHPCISPDDSCVYFSAVDPDKRKFGLDGADIYKIKLLPCGDGCQPENLGRDINSEFNEITPFVSSYNGKPLLFFASDRPGGLGGYDIYSSVYDRHSRRWTPQQLVGNINTTANEAYFTTINNEYASDLAFFASDRKDSVTWNIYRTSPNPAPPSYLIVRGDVSYCDKGKKIQPLNCASVVLRERESMAVIGEVSTDENGSYSIFVPYNKELYLEAYHRGRAFVERKIYYPLPTSAGIEYGYIDFCLQDSVSILPDTVFFNFAESAPLINKQTQTVFKRVEYYMKKYDDAKLKIVGHTDKYGTDKFNMNLSKLRAENIKKAFSQYCDIMPNRIVTEWKGKSLPIDPDCDSKADCAKNRRVEVIYLP
ncbi:MAG: hypothetical protein QG635_621 [Bacteroidota bacterium]|nr:hypothetical protein [Bacteroidota bacterium]